MLVYFSTIIKFMPTRTPIKIIDGKKPCSRCKRLLPIKEFWKKSSVPSGLYSSCKKCMAVNYQKPKVKERCRKWAKEYRQRPEVKERIKEYEKVYKRSSKRKQWLKKYRKTYQRKNTISHKYYGYKYSAIKRNIKFSLTKETFKTFWQKPCSYCGNKIETIGLDRVDNNRGYTINNIIPCCKYCNFMRGNLPQEQFIKRVMKIANYQRNKDDNKLLP